MELELNEYHDQKFTALNLSEADVRHREFDRCHFRHCDFLKVDWRGAEFAECVFEHCSFGLGKFIDCSWKAVKFKNSKLVGVDLARSTINFFELEFTECLLDTCNFSGLPMADTSFVDCIIRECVFGETDLQRAKFQNCDLAKSLFHNTKLDQADFSSASNYTIDPLVNSIKGAKFALPEAVALLRGFDIELDQ